MGLSAEPRPLRSALWGACCPSHVGAGYLSGGRLWTRQGLASSHPRSPGGEPAGSAQDQSTAAFHEAERAQHPGPGRGWGPVQVATPRRLVSPGLAPAWSLSNSLGVDGCEGNLRNLGLHQGLGAWDTQVEFLVSLHVFWGLGDGVLPSMSPSDLVTGRGKGLGSPVLLGGQCSEPHL